jgi:branched-subunit amino acid aminotransferase/4-amino-4-deoxychorismate lyase
MTPAYLHPLTPTTLMTWPTAYAPILNVFLDVAPTNISGTAYYKHTNRDRYMAARKRVGIDSSASVDEVLLWNTEGEVTEGSLRTISVWRDGGWVTPPLSSGCMDGSVRRWMLSTRKVREARILKGDLRPGEWVLTSNGIEGCCFGKFVMMERDLFNSTMRGHGQDTLPGHSTIDYPR